MRFPKTLSWLTMIFLLSVGTVSPLFAQESTADRLERLGGYPCPDSEFTCIKFSVPLDHFAESGGETIEVVFGVLPASGERKGMFVTATGGPGTSGLAAADSYTAAFDPSIPEHFDIVFFDQRGATQSGGLQCPQAAAAYYQSDSRADTPEQEANLIASARTFSEDCLQEMNIAPERLSYYGTNQAIEDLEQFRNSIGDDKLWLYGESYGTQYAQTYAAAHPDHLAGLILDGTVDLSISGTDFLKEQAQAFNDVLVATLDACTQDESCAADVSGGNALTVYDDLRAELATAPSSVKFPLPSGGATERALTLPDLEAAAAGFIYSEGSRMILQRAISAASQGDLVPLARVVYSALVLDPESLQAITDPTYSDALYYAVECNDYDYFSGTPDERAQAYIRAGDAVDRENVRFGSIFYGDLPCAFWPGKPVLKRPAPLVAKGIPTLVLGATTDPATPVENGKRVFKQLDDAYLVTTTGGAHVIFGRGDACPDDLVTAFLVEDKVPDQRETRCEGMVASPYVANAPADAAIYADPLEALNTAYNEIYYLPEYYYWDTSTLTLVGCPYGGTLAFAPSGAGQQLHLSACAFSKGFAMTGTGFSSDGVSDFSLDVTVTGDADGTLTYSYDSEGNILVTGEYAGEVVELTG